MSGSVSKVSKHSQEYENARKEFINCLVMSIIGCGVPLVLAFTEWRPIMREELRKERASASICNG